MQPEKSLQNRLKPTNKHLINKRKTLWDAHFKSEKLRWAKPQLQNRNYTQDTVKKY